MTVTLLQSPSFFTYDQVCTPYWYPKLHTAFCSNSEMEWFFLKHCEDSWRCCMSYHLCPYPKAWGKAEICHLIHNYVAVWPTKEMFFFNRHVLMKPLKTSTWCLISVAIKWLPFNDPLGKHYIKKQWFLFIYKYFTEMGMFDNSYQSWAPDKITWVKQTFMETISHLEPYLRNFLSGQGWLFSTVQSFV